MDFLPRPDVGCHRTGFKEKCRDLVTREQCKCDRWVKVSGKSMDGTETVERWDCVDNMTVWALVEMSRAIVGTTKSIDLFREEMAEANGQAQSLRDPDLIDAFRAAANGRLEPPRG
jgi:hypothetical protein